MMKRTFFICIFLFLFTSMFSQNGDLSKMMILKNEKGDISIEISGYDIFIKTIKGDLNSNKIINSLKKEFNIKEIQNEYSDDNIPISNKVIESTSYIKDRPNVITNQSCYILYKSKTEWITMLFQTLNERDTNLEKAIVNKYLEDNLVEYTTPSWIADSILFVGRKIKLGSACKWKSPHNIQCMGGQISWSEFESFEKAMSDINMRIKANNNTNFTILKEEDIDVIFEGVPSLAHRVVYKYKSPYISYRTLIVYYITQEIRGRFVSCTLSNYGYNKNDYELANLLQEVMTIPVLPETAYNKYDIPQYEEPSETEKEEYKDYINFWEIRAGTWIPLNNLKKRFDISPSIGVHIGLPIKKDMAIDIGFQIAIPINSKQFDFYDKDQIYATKLIFLLASVFDGGISKI